jgi:hypothetical protein
MPTDTSLSQARGFIVAPPSGHFGIAGVELEGRAIKPAHEQPALGRAPRKEKAARDRRATCRWLSTMSAFPARFTPGPDTVQTLLAIGGNFSRHVRYY